MTSPAQVRYDTQDDFAREPVRGLPEMLPRGERILWQGGPSWRGLAFSAYHARAAAGYFALLLVWRTLAGIMAGESAASLATSLLIFAGLAVAAVSTLLLLGYLASRTTVYTITNRRLVMRIGIALPMTLNLPFNVVAAASARMHADGSADIPLQLAPMHRLAFLILWPHCRPWHLRRPEPMLRRIANGARVAEILSDALRAYALEEAGKTATITAPASVEVPRPLVELAGEPGKEPIRTTVAA